MIQWITKQALQELFNNSHYPQMIGAGQLTRTRLKQSHLQDPNPGQGPYCTYSESILYTSEDPNDFVIVHQYVRPDGTLGASGRPDPKKMKIKGQTYATH